MKFVLEPSNSKCAGSCLSDVNTYEIVNADVLVLTESAAKIFAEEAEEVAVEA